MHARRRSSQRAVEKARRKNNRSLLDRVGERRIDGGWRFKEEPPILLRVDAETREAVTNGLERYAETLPRERRFMLSRYQVVDVAHRVVGVGSVGTRAYVALLCGNSDEDSPSFRSRKRSARPCTLPARHARALCQQRGRAGHLRSASFQAVGDPLLGWTKIDGRPFYVRQMKNMKGEIPISRMTGQSLLYFSHAYGALLAKAHARTGDAAAIAGLLRPRGRVDLREALADWAAAYGDRNSEDFKTFRAAIASGRIEAADDPYL